MKKKFRRRKYNPRRGIYLLPNLITTASLFCGFLAMVLAINGEYVRGAWMILLAGVFDLMDGRVARLTGTHSDFGVQYDSLSDLASFGLAPAILAYTWALKNFDKFGWAAAFLFFACGALRLARYNVQFNKAEKNFFMGLAIPCAAVVIASYVIFQHSFLKEPEVQGYLLLVMVVGMALMMVSNIPYRSFKIVNLKSRQSFLILVGAAIGLFIVASVPALMIFLLSLGYLFSGPLELLMFKGTKKSSTDIPKTGPEEPLRIVKGGF